MNISTEAFALSDDKAAAIATTDPRLTVEAVREFCCADWPEGQEHQDWLDSASPEDIGAWMRAGLQ